MKDFYDIWMLSGTHDFEGGVLAEAVEKMFETRGTPLTVEPTVFESSFANDIDKQIRPSVSSPASCRIRRLSRPSQRGS
jgi:hypothetical protein